jgi:hypothetical protein
MAGTVVAFLLRWKDLFALSEAEAQ